YQARSPGGRADLAWLSRSDLLTGLAGGPAKRGVHLPQHLVADVAGFRFVGCLDGEDALTVHAASLTGALTHVSYQLTTRRSGTQVRLCRCIVGRFPRRGRRHAAASNAPVCRVDSHPFPAGTPPTRIRQDGAIRGACRHPDPVAAVPS